MVCFGNRCRSVATFEQRQLFSVDCARVSCVRVCVRACLRACASPSPSTLLPLSTLHPSLSYLLLRRARASAAGTTDDTRESRVGSDMLLPVSLRCWIGEYISCRDCAYVS